MIPIFGRVTKAWNRFLGIMANYNKYKMFKNVIARLLTVYAANDRTEIMRDPTVERKNIAAKIMDLTGMSETKTAMDESKLRSLAQFWSGGLCVTQGRLAKGLEPAFGVKRLTILMGKSRLAELILMKVHKKNHRDAKTALHKSRLMGYWIHRGMNLAERVCSRCLMCRRDFKKLIQLRM